MPALVEMLGEELLTEGCVTVASSDALASKKTVLLYFSAHWCPPCRGFTPVLAEAYKTYRASGGEEAEVVFVSRDKDQEAFKEYYSSMPWLAMPFDQQRSESLMTKFAVKGIPTIVALGPDGQCHTFPGNADLRELINQHKAKVFPATPARVAELQAEAEAKILEVVKDLPRIFPPVLAPGDEDPKRSLDSLFEDREHVMMLFGDGDHTDDVYANIRNTVEDVNTSKGRLVLVYVGMSLYNDDCDHVKVVQQQGFYSVTLDDTTKATVEVLCPNKPGCIILHRQEDGSLTTDGSINALQAVMNYKAKGYPWSKAQIEEIEAQKAARVKELREKQKDLQFLKTGDRDTLSTHSGDRVVPINELAALGDDAIVGIYFSAHWCPPCRGFTPVLAKCYTELKEAGKKFEVIFVSSDADEQSFAEYFKEMPWLALPFQERGLKADLSEIFGVRGIPSLVLLHPDGSNLEVNGREAISYGSAFFPWGTEEMQRGRAEAEERRQKERQAARDAEEAALEPQRKRGGPVLERLRGTPQEYRHDVEARTVHFDGFVTMGAPASLATSGRLYYELELVRKDSVFQVGFATAAMERTDDPTGDGVGDDDKSWGVDGVRQERYFDGPSPWACSLEVNDVIGLAVDVELGKMAVSKNGNWDAEACGVVFVSEGIKAGVFLAFTATQCDFKYNLDGSSHGAFKFAPPPPGVWEREAVE